MSKSGLASLKPWMEKPLELIFHAETHYRDSSDYSKRMSYINFDNAVEVSINTFIYLHTKPRGKRIFKEEESKSAKSYFNKLELFESYIQSKGLPIKWDKVIINYYHEQRNHLYHDSSLSSPDSSELNAIRRITFWVFSVLFDVARVEDILDDSIEKAELQFPQIPKEYARPEITGIARHQETSLFIASILGGWNDTAKGDNDIIRKVTKDAEEWKSVIREIKNDNDEFFSLKNGNWKVKEKFHNLSKYSSFFYDPLMDLFKDVSLEVLSEIHPMFDLKPEDRLASVLYGKYPKYSAGLRRGISETLVFLGMNGKEFKNCSHHKPEDTVLLTIRGLFSGADWKLWASLNDILPILAEADPGEFLSSVENAFKQSPCPFDELFRQESEGGIMGDNYMTGLYWALETLAWSEKYFSRAILVLAELAVHDPGGRWANRPGNSIITILLPWFPQTMAPTNKRTASLKSVQRNFPDIAWKVLMNLLPNKHQTSMESNKPLFRKYIPEEWKVDVSESEYWEQVREYAAMAVDMAKRNPDHFLELINNLQNIPQPSFGMVLEYLSSDDIVGLPDEQKVTIWEKLISLVGEHRDFPEAKWALPAETITLLEQIAEKTVPSTPEFLYRHLFDSKNPGYKNSDEDWQTYEKNLCNRRFEALKQIYEINKINSVVKFAESVKNPEDVGSTFAYIANKENDSELLPSFLDNQEKFIERFIGGYIWIRYRNGGLDWIESLHTMDWSNIQKCNFFLNLPFENKVWEKANKILGEHIDDYWKAVDAYPSPSHGSLLPAIENLLKHGRPRFAFACIYNQYHFKKEFFKDQAINALINGISSDEHIEKMDSYRIIEIIKILQNDPDVDEKDLFKIEWGYLPLLDGDNNAEPKLLEKCLSQDPDFFVEIIRLLYPSSKHGEFEKKAIEKRNLNYSAHKLLHNWKRPPGRMDDGSFSGEALKKWFDEVKIRTIESGHFERAMIHLGHVLFYAGADSNGLWIQQSAAEMLDGKDNDYIRQGFRSEVYNLYEVQYIDPSGKEEKGLADLWRRNADEIENSGLTRFATTLKELADSLDRDAEWALPDSSSLPKNENNSE